MQKERPIAVKSPLGEDVLLFHRMTARDELGRLFQFDLDLLSKKDDLKLEDVLGQSLTVRLALQDGGERFFNGYASQFAMVGSMGDYARYQATLRPWLWFLTRTADCRIFQVMTVPEIVMKIFREHPFAEFEAALEGTYRKRGYCVQYRETDFDFLSRLMEEEGIYYYFKHEDGKHKVVLSDAYRSHATIPGYGKVPYFPPSKNVVREEDHIEGWSVTQEIQPGAYALTDYDFWKPNAALAVKSTVTRKHAQAAFEVYDYPGTYYQTSDGQAYAKSRIEALQAQHEQVRGSGNARGLLAGGLFELTGFPRDDQDREYLIVSVDHELKSNEYESDAAALPEMKYGCRFQAIQSKQPYRSLRLTPKPVVQGPQTAIVVGPAGEEIHTDKYGRVKVQFHWDREGKSDENSSCWVRVASVWAGKTWGGIQIPRIGQEVVVDFLEGDPDRPIVTGRVYNAEAMPPYELPAKATQSGLKSRSTKGGSGENFNEFRFEDKKGEEQVYLHAEKNQDIMVEHDETHEVGNDRTKEVKHDEKTTIGNDRTESVGNDETIDVTKNQKITIGENRTESVGKNESISIEGLRTKSVGKDEAVSIKGARTETVGKDETISIAGNRTEDVGKKETLQIADGRQHTIGKDDMLSVGKKLLTTAGDEIVLMSGDASITMKKNGDIVIKGKNIKIDGSGKVNVNASGDVIIKGSKIAQN